MNRYIRFIAILVLLLIVTADVTLSQEVLQFRKTITFSCEGTTQTDSAVIGINSGNPAVVPPVPENTYMPDVDIEFLQWRENIIPPVNPPLYSIFAHLSDVRPPTWGTGVRLKPYDFRGYDAFDQVDSFLIKVYAGMNLPDGVFPASGLTISWPADLDHYATT
jgi:hypothetical protein